MIFCNCLEVINYYLLFMSIEISDVVCDFHILGQVLFGVWPSHMSGDPHNYI